MRIFGQLLLRTRFARCLKVALVRHLLEEHPELANKVHDLTIEQFENVCQQVRGELE
jgi:hypothetical protein